jgi:hypothetical protein
MQVALGSLSITWGKSENSALAIAAFFSALGNFFEKINNNQCQTTFSKAEISCVNDFYSVKSGWLHNLINTSKIVLGSSESELENVSKLINVGMKHGKNFLVPEKDASSRIPQVFGVCDLMILLPMLRGSESRINLLSQIATKYDVRVDDVVIRYFIPPNTELQGSSANTNDSAKGTAYHEIRSHGDYKYQDIGGDVSEKYKKEDFFACHRLSEKIQCHCLDNPLEECREGVCPCLRGGFSCSAECHTSLSNDHSRKCERLASIVFHSSPAEGIEISQPGQFNYDFLLGDHTSAAIYVLRGSKTDKDALRFQNPSTVLGISDITSLIASDVVRADALLLHLARISENLADRERPFYESLKALAAAAKVYQHLPSTTVAIGVIEEPVYSWHWTNDPKATELPTAKPQPPDSDRLFPRHRRNVYNPLSSLLPRPLSLTETFSCVALFESGRGHCNIKPDLLQGVMALSSGDSIFVAAPLLCDPSEILEPYELRRIVGNIGRAGITMLVPPANPLIRSIGPESWNVLNHADFDGKSEDSFRGTTLHLSFTEYNPPIHLGNHGAQDDEVFILESVVSVHDHGRWVADLDIIQALKSPLLHHLAEPPELCSHVAGEPPSTKLTSIDSWEEFLDRAENVSIARAHGNWVARLSLVSIGISQGVTVVVCPSRVCWKCDLSSKADDFKGEVFIQ